MFKSFLKSNSGATAIEYTLVIGLVVVVLVTMIDFVHETWSAHHTRNVSAVSEQHSATSQK